MSHLKRKEIIITEDFYGENSTDLHKKQMFPYDFDLCIKNENIELQKDITVFNSKRLEEKEITYDMVNKMKKYFSSYFIASPSITREIFSVKNNTIQHPIYAFRGGCFICNQSGITHMKDERAIEFLAKKNIKLLKNMNVFSLLDNQSYIEDESFINAYNYNFYDEDIEIVMNNKNIETHNSAPLATEENIDDENTPNYNTEKFIYSSFYSDSNFEFAKSNYREQSLNINTIKEEIKKQIENLDEQFNHNNNALNMNFTKGQISVNLSSYENKNLLNKIAFFPKRNSIISCNNRNINLKKSEEISAEPNLENSVASKHIQENFSFGKNFPDLNQYSHNTYNAQCKDFINIKKNYELENEYYYRLKAERPNRYSINQFGQSYKNEYLEKRNLISCNSNKNFNFKIKEYNNVIREENSIHSLHSERNLTTNKIIDNKKINLITKSQSHNTLIGDYIPNTIKNTLQGLSRASSLSRQINSKRFSINPFENKYNISIYSNNSSKKKNIIRMTTINFKRPISLNISGRIKTELGGRFSIKHIKEKHNLYLKKEKEKTNPDEKYINKLDKDINQNTDPKRCSNAELELQQAMNSTNDMILKNYGNFNNNTNLSNSNRKINRNFKSTAQSNKKKPLIQKFYKGDCKGISVEKKNHINLNNFCDICLSTIQFEKTEEILRLSCGHFYCLECIKEYIKDSIIKLNSRNLKSICICPKPVCGAVIPLKEIEGILKDDKKNFEIFNECLNKIEIINNLNNIIICPTPDCESYAKREFIEKNLTRCEKNHIFCVKCRKPKHSGPCQRLSCDDLATEKFLKNNSDFKKCPKCMTNLYKFSECKTNIVRCGYKLCDYEYCWLCGRIPEKTHYTNPLSSCYKLEKIDTKHVLATNDCLRMTKYFIIVLLTMLLIPFLIILSTFLFSTFYILAFVPDGSAVKHIKMQKRQLELIFKFFVSGIYIWMAFPLVPLGYLLQGTLIVLSPFIYLYKKFIKYKSLHI